MVNSIVAHSDSEQLDVQNLVDNWLKLESEGEQFPVNFDIAWKIAGYSTKANAKRKLTGKTSYLIQNQDYVLEKGDIIRSEQSLLNGRSSDLIRLSCDAFKHFCLIAETEQGRQIRQYFIEAEKKWRIVQRDYPQVAQKVEQQSETDKLILLEQLRLKNKEMDNTMLVMHGAPVVLALRGCADQLVKEEIVVTEVVNVAKNRTDRIVSADTLKKYARHRYGQKVNSMKEIVETLQELGRDDMLVPVERSNTNLYIKADYLNEALELVFGRKYQGLIGE